MQSCIAARVLERLGGSLGVQDPCEKQYVLHVFQSGVKKGMAFHRDPGQQGTPPVLQNARAALRICKADINICREGRAESIGFS